MVIVLLFASFLGGSVTLALLWPYGVLVAVLGAPFSGSIMAVLVGGLIALRGLGHGKSLDLAREQATDELVVLVKQATEQVLRSESPSTVPTQPVRQAA